MQAALEYANREYPNTEVFRKIAIAAFIAGQEHEINLSKAETPELPKSESVDVRSE